MLIESSHTESLHPVARSTPAPLSLAGSSSKPLHFDALTAIEDYPGHPTFLIDSKGFVVTLNAAASRLVEAGSCVVISGGLLCAADPVLTRGWRLRLNSVLLTEKACTVRVPQGVKSRTVAFMPVGDKVLIRFEREQACDTAAIEAFAYGCGLTSSETGVVLELAAGMGAKEIAEKSNRSELTIRSHFKKILKKTQTDSARELTAVLSRLPPVA